MTAGVPDGERNCGLYHAMGDLGANGAHFNRPMHVRLLRRTG